MGTEKQQSVGISSSPGTPTNYYIASNAQEHFLLTKPSFPQLINGIKADMHQVFRKDLEGNFSFLFSSIQSTNLCKIQPHN